MTTDTPVSPIDPIPSCDKCVKLDLSHEVEYLYTDHPFGHPVAREPSPGPGVPVHYYICTNDHVFTVLGDT